MLKLAVVSTRLGSPKVAVPGPLSIDQVAVTTPGATLPDPMAAIMLSPPPAETNTSAPKPNRSAISGRTVPAGASGAMSSGRQRASRPVSSIARSIGPDHSRRRASK